MASTPSASDQVRELLTVEELSSRLHIKPGTVYAWVSQRRIPHLKLGKLVRFDPEKIEVWLAAGRQEAEWPLDLNRRNL